MTPLPHAYQVSMTSTAAGYGTLSAERLPPISVASPPQYDGPGDAWSPEHLLLASVASCFAMTFRAVARASRLAFIDLDVRVDGSVAKAEGVVRFTQIVLHPRITLAEGVDRERVIHAVEKAESHCLVSASLVTPVDVVPEVIEAGATAA